MAIHDPATIMKLDEAALAKCNESEANINASLETNFVGLPIVLQVDSITDAIMGELIRRCEQDGRWVAMATVAISPVSVAAGKPSPIPGTYILTLRPRWYRS